MPEDRLTLDTLVQLHEKFQADFPKRKPIVGIIMNPAVLSALKYETSRLDSRNIKDDRPVYPFDYLMGAPIWISNEVESEHTEIWYDAELLKSRLKQLKIQ